MILYTTLCLILHVMLHVILHLSWYLNLQQRVCLPRLKLSVHFKRWRSTRQALCGFPGVHRLHPLSAMTLLSGALLIVAIMSNVAYAQTVSVGVLDERMTDADITFWTKTANRLTQQITEHQFTIKPMGYECLTNAIQKKQLDFVITSPAHLVALEADGARALATLQTQAQGQAQDRFGATLIALQNRDDLTDLSNGQDQSIIARTPFEFGGFQIMKRELLQAGMSLENDFLELRFTNGSQENIVKAILNDDADIGIVRSGLIEKMLQEGTLPANTLKVLHPKQSDHYPLLHSSALYAEWQFIRLASTDIALARAVSLALRNMPKASQSVGYEPHFGWTDPTDLTTVSGLLRALQLSPFEPPVKISVGRLIAEYGVVMGLTLVLFITLLLSILRVSHINKKLQLSQTELATHRDNLEAEVKQRTQELSQVNRALEEDIKARESVEFTLRRSRSVLQGFYEISVAPHSSHSDKLEKLLSLARVHFQMSSTFLYKVDHPHRQLDAPSTWVLQAFDGDPRYENEAVRCIQANLLQPVYGQIQTYENNQCNKRLHSLMVKVDQQPHRMLVFIGDLLSDSQFTEVDQELLQLMTQWIGAAIERQAIEQESEIYRSQLGKVTRLFTVGEMASGLAHEINQPLTAAVNYISGSLRRLKEGRPGEIDVGLKRALESLNRATDIIRHLREFVQTGVPRSERFDLVSSINQVLDLLRSEAAQHQTALKLSTPQTAIFVLGDSVQIEQVILNLVRNAIEASSGQGEVQIVLELTDSNVQISVIDTGSGIEEEVMESVFDAFHSSKPQGMGLGLAICRSIVEAHSSHLNVQNNAKGCQFMFQLPLAALDLMDESLKLT